MADLWYYGDEECKLGPFSGPELRDLATCGLIHAADTVWKEGIEKGVLARKVKNLFPPGHADAPPVGASVSPTGQH